MKRFFAAAAAACALAACSSGTGELGPGVNASKDAGPPVEDASMPPPVEPHGCMLGWVTVAEATPGTNVTGESFAAQPEGFAIVWSIAGPESPITMIGFFDKYGELRSPPTPVGERSRVIAFEGGFLRGGLDGLERYDVTGKSLDTATHVFVPLARVGQRVWGLNRDYYISAAPVGPLDGMGPFAVGVGGAYRTVAFSEDRFVIEDESHEFDAPLTVRVYEFGPRSAIEIQATPLPADMIDGETHFGHALGGAAWNADAQRFELLVGMRLGSTRQFGARLMNLDQTSGLVDGTRLYDVPTSVAYESLTGAVAIGANGTIALAYRSPYNASELSLDLVRGAAVEHFMLMSGSSYPTDALLAAVEDRFAVVYGVGAAATNVFEKVLQLRCDLPAGRESCGTTFCTANERCNEWTRACQPLDVPYPPLGEDNGGQCTMDSECKSNGSGTEFDPVCVTENGSDYCSSRCALPGDFGVPAKFERSDCPEGSLCFQMNQYNYRPGVGSCVPACTEDSECRTEDGYYCRKTIGGRTYENGYCAPAHCQSRGCVGYACHC